MSKRKQLSELPVRQCRWGERCLICLGEIERGRRYHDGKHGRRAHLGCAQDVQAGRKREPTRAEVRELDEAEQAVSEAKGVLHNERWHGEPSLEAAAQDSLALAEERVEDLKQLWADPDGEQ